MSVQSPRTPQPPFTGAMSLADLLADQPPVRDVGTNLDQIRAGRRLVVLDDDPTGTQSIADLPVLTSWSVADLRWALQQPTTGFFVLTNTRSLSEADAAERNRQVVDALDQAARAGRHVPYVIASRSDSTLRGYFPLETDVLADELAALGTSRRRRAHLPGLRRSRAGSPSTRCTGLRTDDGMIPVAHERVRQGRQLRLPQLRPAGLGRGEDRRRIAAVEGRPDHPDRHPDGGPDRVQEILTGLERRPPRGRGHRRPTPTNRWWCSPCWARRPPGRTSSTGSGPRSSEPAPGRRRPRRSTRNGCGRSSPTQTGPRRRRSARATQHGLIADRFTRRADHPSARPAPRPGHDHRGGAGRTDPARRHGPRRPRPRDRRARRRGSCGRTGPTAMS